VGKPRPDQFDLMLSDWQNILPKLRQEHALSNCPLTAQAVFNYFRTGVIKAAPALLNGAFVMEERGDPANIALKDVRPTMKRKPHGSFAVLTINPNSTDKQHSVVVVTIRGVVCIVDAYNKPGVVTTDLERHLSYGKSFQITFNADIRVVPAK